MTDQLQLLDLDPTWQMDSATREQGRRGVALARAALDEARARRVVDGRALDVDEGHELAPAA